MANAISIKNLWFSYGSTSVFENLNFTVKESEFVALLGHNGTGKTTLLKILLGFLKPNKGEVLLFGTPVSLFSDWHKIGYVQQTFENFDLTFPSTVEEVVSMTIYSKRAFFYKLSKEEQEAVQGAIRVVGMEEFKNRKIGELSGGQQQRVFLARALASSPKLLLLDEPTTAVDFASQQRFYSLLKQLNQELGLSILLISHDLGQIFPIVDRIAVLNKRIVFDGSPKTFTKEKIVELMGTI
ncbi:MAG: metal ABC transporter ATP-binding protein [Candidatus Anstonellales archaeon]